MRTAIFFSIGWMVPAVWRLSGYVKTNAILNTIDLLVLAFLAASVIIHLTNSKTKS